MSPVFKKLNLKDQDEIAVLAAPESFEPELASLEGVRVRRKLTGVKSLSFALAFATRQKDLDRLATQILKRAGGDATIWFAYPKGSSKKYSCDFNRDTGWRVVGEMGFEGVRQVSIDEDWSAVRFRRVEFIKNLTRDKSWVLSAEGKKRKG